MDFDLSKPQRLLKDSACDFLARECKPQRVRGLIETDTAHDDKLWQAIADQGWMGLVVPEEHGGLGLTEPKKRERNNDRGSGGTKREPGEFPLM